MVESVAQTGRRNWRPLRVLCIIELVLFISLSLFDADAQFLPLLFFVVPALILTSVVLIVLLVRAAIGYGRPQLLPLLAMLAVLWAIPTAFIFYDRAYPYEIRETARWLVSYRNYKNEVLAQPDSANGNLKYMEWDATGFAGIANNSDYLVFDPTDRLLAAAKKNAEGKFDGLPCKVRQVRRLESHWYVVFFYTDQEWDYCGT